MPAISLWFLTVGLGLIWAIGRSSNTDDIGLDNDKNMSVSGWTCSDDFPVKNAIQAAKRNAQQKDLIYMGGSIFVVAEVLDYFKTSRRS